jgi:hypothetical protein
MTRQLSSVCRFRDLLGIHGDRKALVVVEINRCLPGLDGAYVPHKIDVNDDVLPLLPASNRHLYESSHKRFSLIAETQDVIGFTLQRIPSRHDILQDEPGRVVGRNAR